MALPRALREVSGLARDDQGSLWAINDEKGTLYRLDDSTWEVTEKVRFGPDGDYEALCFAKESVYIMRSDRTLIRWNASAPSELQQWYVSGLPVQCETEAIAISDNQLFTICKTQLAPAGYTIYQLKQEGRGYSADPVVDLTNCIENALLSKGIRNGIIHPSDLLYDPGQDIWILLSTKPSAVFAISSEGIVQGIFLLDEKAWPQPEGIALARDTASYWISSEGRSEGWISLLRVK